jgi:hypothetical protein
MTTKTKKELAELKRTVARNHQAWIEDNPRSTLGDLRDYMLGVQDEMIGHDEDDPVAELGGDAGQYCAGFGEGDVTVGYRLGNVEEDIQLIEELIEEVGERYKVRSLNGTGDRRSPEPLTEKQKKYVEFLLKRLMGVPDWTRQELLGGPWQPWVKTRLQRLLG